MVSGVKAAEAEHTKHFYMSCTFTYSLSLKLTDLCQINKVLVIYNQRYFIYSEREQNFSKVKHYFLLQGITLEKQNLFIFFPLLFFQLPHWLF